MIMHMLNAPSDHARDHIQFIFRGQEMRVQGFTPTRSLLNWLREEQRATGTKEGCNEGDCGACTVILARVENGALVHRPVNSCITFLGMADGAEVLTVEDLAVDGRLHKVQQAMVDHHGSQCGFCTPGIVMSLVALDKAGGEITRARIHDQLAGNLCRCTGYRPIVDAALSALDGTPDHLDQAAPARLTRLKALGEDGAFIAHGEGFFAAPRMLDELLALYAAHPDATILAGATDVGLWITKQFRPIKKLIWLGRLQDLQTITDSDEVLVIGAGVSHAAALPALARISPDLGELGRRFGSTQVRAQGTVGGNIANGSPIGDWAPAFIALGASVELKKRAESAPLTPQTGSRRLPLENFFIAYGKQDREPGEIVASLTIPKLGPHTHFRCLKISKRFDEDISALMGAFCLTVEGSIISAARIAFGGMAATPKRAPATEAALVGASLTDRATWDMALEALATDYQPIGDMRASARYRATTARALLTKALIEIGGGTHTRLSAPELTNLGETIHAS
jgi:xanthine dehydrogenase small subunit